ncbi:MAG: hypothetical protein ACYDFU_10005 [Nitrospirota bacterium]
MSIKGKRMMIAFCYHLGIISISLVGVKIGAFLDSPGLVGVSVVLLALHLLTFRVIPVSRWIQESLIREATCTICGAQVEIVNLYKCGCGYTQARHAFSPCPMCGTSFQWVICPECESSIPI